MKTNYFLKRINRYLHRVFLAAFLLFPFCAKAQYSHLYYHCQRDTIIQDAETYYHGWWEFENSLTTQQIYNIANTILPVNKMLLYHFTDTPLQVVGLAILPPIIVTPGYSDDPYYYYDTTVLREYLYLCEAGADTTYELAKVRWLPADTSRFIKVVHTESRHLDPKMPFIQYVNGGYASPFDTFCCGGVPFSHITNVAEYYFENPITVTDSFYVGCSNISYDPYHSNTIAGNLYPQQRYLMATQGNTAAFLDCNGDTSDWYLHGINYSLWLQTRGKEGVCRIQWPAIIENHWSEYENYPMTASSYNPDGTYYISTPYIPLVFPIVIVDTTVPPRSYCPKVENLQVSSDSIGCINLSWDAFVNHRNGYDIFYGPRNLPESEWSTLYVENNFAQICDLDTNYFYQFRVAPVCDSLQNSAHWVTSSSIRPTSGATAEIADPSALARHTVLSPNPTTGIVHLHSDYVVTRLDLYDVQGRHLDNRSFPGLDTDLDLSPLPNGLYYLLITTSQGITTKQIIKRFTN